MLRFFSFLVVFAISSHYLYSYNGFQKGPMSDIAEESGILEQIHSTDKIFARKKHDLSYFHKHYSEDQMKNFLLNFIERGLLMEEVKEVQKLFRNPFIAKISKVFLTPVKNPEAYEEYIEEHGRKAIKDKVTMIQEINKLILPNSSQSDFEIAIIKAERMQRLKEDPANRNNTITELEERARKYTIHSEKQIMLAEQKNLVPSIYYKARKITLQELQHFHKTYGNNELLKKFYRLNQQGRTQFYRNVYEKLISSN
jgi:hypothetical protein